MQVCERTPAAVPASRLSPQANLWSAYVETHKAAAAFRKEDEEEEEKLVLVAAVVEPNP